MANKVLLVAKSRIEANRLAPDYGISRFTYVFGAAGVRRLVPSDTVWLLPGWKENPAKFAIENALRYTRATVKRPAPVDAQPFDKFHCEGCGEDYDEQYELDIHECPAVEMKHCDGCGEDYNALEESHVGHEPMPPMQKVVNDVLDQQAAETQKVLENLGKGAQVDEAKGTVTFPISGEIPQRDYDFRIVEDPSMAPNDPGILVPEGAFEPTPPPLPPLPDDWQDVGYTDVDGLALGGVPDAEQIEVHSGQSPDPIRTYQESPVAMPTLATNTTGKPEPVLTADEWDSIVTTDKHDVEPEETSAETATPEPSQDLEEAPAEVEPKVKRRRRRCKDCGILVEPDDVEAHAATHVEA